jgi:hypothetical protein
MKETPPLVLSSFFQNFLWLLFLVYRVLNSKKRKGGGKGWTGLTGSGDLKRVWSFNGINVYLLTTRVN